MFYITVLITLCLTSPIFAATSFCFECANEINVNYLVTIDNLPSFDQCRTVLKKVCIVDFYWDDLAKTTTIRLFGMQAHSSLQLPDNSLTAYSTLETIPSNGSLSSTRGFLYICRTEPNCNDKTGIQRILQSLIIQNQFQQQLTQLVQDVPSFNPNTAACFNYINYTEDCSPTDLQYCERCHILVDLINSPGQEICASCPVPSYAPTNKIIRTRTFSLSDKKDLNDQVEISCQTNGCNSLYNINQVLRFSRITYDYGKINFLNEGFFP